MTVTVKLNNPGLIAMRIFVRYDSAVLQLDRAENGDVFPQNTAVFGKDTSADPYTLLWDDSLRTDNITQSGTLCTLHFTIRKAADGGSTGIRIAVDKGSTFDVNLQEVTVSDATCTVTTDGTVSIKPTLSADIPTLTKTSTAAASTKPMAGTAKPITAAAVTPGKTTAVSASSGTAAAPAHQSSAAQTASAAAATTVAASAESTAPAATDAPEKAGTTAPAVETQAETKSVPAHSDESEAPSRVETIGASKPAERHISLWWLLCLVPVAALLLFVLFKKKNNFYGGISLWQIVLF